MKVSKLVLVFGVIFSLSFIAVGAAQDQQADSTRSAPDASQEVVAPMEEAVAPAAEKTTEWVWGEVVSVDKENKELVIKHLDYDTYEEVQTALKLDDKTLLENVTDLGEIQPRDHVTVDYKADKGSNIAGLIVIEKSKETTPLVEVKTDQVSVKILDPEAAPGSQVSVNLQEETVQ